MSADIVIGVDAGTSVIKSIAFDLAGRQLAFASVPNAYSLGEGGTATQSLTATWDACARTLAELASQVEGLASRIAAVAVTGQGDGTWLIDGAGEPVGDALTWLDARANPIVSELRDSPRDGTRYELTGTGLNACQMGAQLAHLKRHEPAMVAAAATAFHCKDWLYFKLTGERVTDPSEGTFTFGDFRTRAYADEVIDALGLNEERRLLPPMLDGTLTHHALSDEAARATGLAAGTPVALGFVDVCCTALGAGLYDPPARPGCTVIGSTGIHMALRRQDDITLSQARTGYVMVLPVPDMCAQLQTNMAATLNIDWILKAASDLIGDVNGAPCEARELLSQMDRWVDAARPGEVLYHPYISEAGERGPITDGTARASFVGLSSRHSFADLVRAIVEGLAFAARDCYEAIGGPPEEVRLTGGAARSETLRQILGAALAVPVRTSSRDEAGAAGAAMIGAVSVGAYATMAECVAQWVSPQLNEAEPPDPELARRYRRLFPSYRATREALQPVWSQMARAHG